VAFFKHIRQAIANLNPDDVRQSAERTVNVGIVAPTQEALWRLEAHAALRPTAITSCRDMMNCPDSLPATVQIS